MRLKRPRRHVTAAHRVARPAAGTIKRKLVDGLRLRRAVRRAAHSGAHRGDDYSRESLAIEVGQNITGDQAVAVMNRIAGQR
jgi:putative transposase